MVGLYDWFSLRVGGIEYEHGISILICDELNLDIQIIFLVVHLCQIFELLLNLNLEFATSLGHTEIFLWLSAP